MIQLLGPVRHTKPVYSNSMSSLTLFSLLSVIGAMPLALLVAATQRIKLREAIKKISKFLETWAGMAPKAIHAYISTAIGFSGGFIFLVALTYILNSLGNATMPHYSRAAHHFGRPLTMWSVEHEPDWKKFKNAFQNRWQKEHPQQKWDDLKTETLSKWQVRAARVLFYYSLLLLLAGVVDLGFVLIARLLKFTWKRFFKRGISVTLIGLAASFVCLLIWVDRKQYYINEVVRVNDALESPVRSSPSPPQ